MTDVQIAEKAAKLMAGSPSSGPNVTRPKRNGASKPLKSYHKSRVSNGRDILPDVDGRSLIARRYRDIASAILIDQGGVEACSESRQQLVRRFAAAAVLAEMLEAQLARGEKVDISQHALLCSTLVRVARQIGVDRIAKNISPTLSDYFKSEPPP
jgi:hypothetical protein